MSGRGASSSSMSGMLAPLRHHAFRWLATGRFANYLGNAIAPIALAFAVLDLTGSVVSLGVVVGARSLANVLLLLFGGVLADRLPRPLVLQGRGVRRGRHPRRRRGERDPRVRLRAAARRPGSRQRRGGGDVDAGVGGPHAADGAHLGAAPGQRAAAHPHQRGARRRCRGWRRDRRDGTAALVLLATAAALCSRSVRTLERRASA